MGPSLAFKDARMDTASFKVSGSDKAALKVLGVSSPLASFSSSSWAEVGRVSVFLARLAVLGEGLAVAGVVGAD